MTKRDPAWGKPVNRRVRVWFGEHAIADYRGAEAPANHYAEAMERRFAGLRVTNEPVNDEAVSVR